MKAINTGNVYNLYDDSVKTFDQLPAQTYTVCFNPKMGFWLEKFSDFEITEKIYGVHDEKVNKVFNSFKLFSRNLGVILSGDKGIGKSLFAKMLSAKAVENGYPLIIVNDYIPGIADFINEIEQEVVVLFDEFDKTFCGKYDERNTAKDPQTEMLTLFDGMSVGKKLFIITCNELRSLNDYLVNRPGRFHYHFRFEYPQAEEIREYLQDKLSEQYWKEIDNVISFSKKINLNYDCLRAIAFELSLGLSFKDAIADLNIVNISRELYDLYLYFEDGSFAIEKNASVNMFSNDEVFTWLRYHGECCVNIKFNPMDSIYSVEHNACIIPADSMTIEFEEDEDEYSNKSVFAKTKTLTPSRLMIKKQLSKDIHYLV